MFAAIAVSEVATGEGNAKEFSCPYHGWLYDLKGQLQGVPFMKNVKDFDFKNCRLKTLRTAIWGGFVFVNFDPDAEPFEDYVKDFDNAFGMLKMEECRLAHKLVADLDCNWKLVVENFMDLLPRPNHPHRDVRRRHRDGRSGF